MGKSTEAWIADDDWEPIYEPVSGSSENYYHRAWLGHGWLVESSSGSTGGVAGLTFVPVAPRGPWASPASAVDQLGEIATAQPEPQRSTFGPMTEEEMAQVKAGRVLPLPPRGYKPPPLILQPEEPKITSTPGWPHP